MKFKVGDKVRIVKNNWADGITRPSIGINEVHTIVEFSGITKNPYILDKYKNLCWNDEELELVSANQKIVITTDGEITTAKLYENGKVVKTTEAKCCPEDTFDFNVGAKLAVERLTAPVEEWKVVKRPVKVGDYIRLIRKDYSFDTVGDILKVDKVIGNGTKSGVLIYEKNHPNRKNINDSNSPNFTWCYAHYEYEIVEKVTKTPVEEIKYYNGKVVCITNYYEDRTPISGFTIGKVYTVTNGKIVNDNGFVSMQYRDIKSLCGGMGNTFIPLVED